MSARSFRMSLLALGLGALAVACKQPTPTPLPPPVAITVTAEDVVVVRQSLLETGPRVSGTLEARERAMVRAEVGGQVVAVGPELGEAVAKGALLVRIEVKSLGDGVRSADASVSSALAGYEVAKREAERAEALVKGGALAAREADRARAALAAAQAAVTQARSGAASARSQLGDAVLRSPISGVVARRDVNVGDIVMPGTSLYDLMVPATMRLSASVSSDDLTAIAIGKSVVFTVRGYPGQTFDGTIARIAPAADAVTRQIPILVDLPNPGGKLIAGLYAEGRIAAEQRQAMVVPQAAVDTTSDRPSVMRVKDGVAERVTVTVGLRDDRQELIELTTGVAIGERVLLNRAARGITPGAKVTLPGDAAKPAGPATAPVTKPALAPTLAPPGTKPAAPAPSAKPSTAEHG